MKLSQTVAALSTKQHLGDILLGERRPHALILGGRTGYGSLALALAYASRLLCQNPSADSADACGACASCGKSFKYVHPDLHFSFPTVGTNVTADSFYAPWRQFLVEHSYGSVQQWLAQIGTENQQGNINKSECQRIMHHMHLKPYEQGVKVLVMWLPEFLGKEGNRLLKLIEEPPPDTLFVFVTEDTGQILPTILSRCQLVQVPPVPDAELAEALVRQHKCTLVEANSIARICDGHYAQALDMLTQAHDDRSAIFVDWLRQCYAGNGVTLVPQVEAITALGRERIKFLLSYGLFFLREMLLMHYTQTTGNRLTTEESQSAQKLAKLMQFDQMVALKSHLDEAIGHIERNANPRTLMLSTSLRIHKLLRQPA
jgi:DNA polymerase-3 subunit delta'